MNSDGLYIMGSAVSRKAKPEPTNNYANQMTKCCTDDINLAKERPSPYQMMMEESDYDSQLDTPSKSERINNCVQTPEVNTGKYFESP